MVTESFFSCNTLSFFSHDEGNIIFNRMDDLCFSHANQDLQKGLDLGLVSPEALQNFFDLEQYPVIAELTHQFQVRSV